MQIDERYSARALSELAAHVGGELRGDGSVLIEGVGGLAEAGPHDLSFYGDARYRPQLLATRAAAVLVAPGEEVGRSDVAVVHVAQPHLAFARISALFHPAPSFAPGVSPRAQVDPSAVVDPKACVMGFATVEAGARVGAGAVLFPGVFVGSGAVVGEGTVLHPNVTVREGCRVGNRVVVHASAVIGADGFGFAFDPAGPAHVKVPQAGTVRVEDDVEIGAGSCVDRATTGETVIGRGTKIDNLVQIGHNVRVGPLSILCAQVGISGSSELGTGVVLAGQVGIAGHLKLGDRAKVGAQSGVAQDVPAGITVTGYPAVERWSWLRQSAALKQLAGALKELRLLRERVAALEKEKPR